MCAHRRKRTGRGMPIISIVPLRASAPTCGGTRAVERCDVLTYDGVCGDPRWRPRVATTRLWMDQRSRRALCRACRGHVEGRSGDDIGERAERAPMRSALALGAVAAIAAMRPSDNMPRRVDTSALDDDALHTTVALGARTATRACTRTLVKDTVWRAAIVRMGLVFCHARKRPPHVRQGHPRLISALRLASSHDSHPACDHSPPIARANIRRWSQYDAPRPLYRVDTRLLTSTHCAHAARDPPAQCAGGTSPGGDTSELRPPRTARTAPSHVPGHRKWMIGCACVYRQCIAEGSPPGADKIGPGEWKNLHNTEVSSAGFTCSLRTDGRHGAPAGHAAVNAGTHRPAGRRGDQGGGAEGAPVGHHTAATGTQQRRHCTAAEVPMHAPRSLCRLGTRYVPNLDLARTVHRPH